MSVNLAFLGLAIDSSATSAEARNFRPASWPPADDFPIVLDANGQIVCRYGDPIWDLRPWAKKPVIIDFGDGPVRKGAARNSRDNANLLRQIAAWWLYGPSPVRSPITFRQRFYQIRPLFFLASESGIVASDLNKFPAVIDAFRFGISPAAVTGTLALLHALFEQREALGFVLLDHMELSRLEAALPEHEARQTPYIPPRIWVYQVNRLRSFLDDFHIHRDRIQACYLFCLDAYATNAGSLGEACKVGRNKTSGPFWVHKRYTGARTGFTYHGPFIQTAKHFGLDELLKRWTVNPSDSVDSEHLSVRSLSTYFSMVGYVGMAYLLNFSLMRIDEGHSLRTDCLDIEQDQHFGPIYILRGPTTKTLSDSDARWPTSPSAKVAVDAMALIAKLRMICAEANPDVPTTADEIRNPYLIVRPYEPWGPGNSRDLRESLAVRPQVRTYHQAFNDVYLRLFNREELRITLADWQAARLINPSLDCEKFAVGKIWPLAWHQLRRTGAVNMQASGLVSDASLQYLLKHASRAMSLYYAHGYSNVGLDENARGLYVRAMYEVLGLEIAKLFADRFVSPHGTKRKDEILKIVNLNDSRQLLALAKSGRVSWRETLLGGCTRRGPCPYGGIDNVARCGGGDGDAACADALYDREKAPELRELGKLIRSRMKEASEESPYRKSLESQQLAVENALYAIEHQ